VDYVYLNAVGLLEFILKLTFSLSTHYTLVGAKSVYASVVLNSITSPDPCKIVRIKQTFVSRCHHRVFSHIKNKNVNVLIN